MEGGGWERPLEEKVDLEKHESGESQFVLVCNVGFSWKKCCKLFSGSFSSFYQGLNPAEKLPLPLFQIQFLKWCDQEEDSGTNQDWGIHWDKKTIATSSSARTVVDSDLKLRSELWVIWSKGASTQQTRQDDLLVWNFCYIFILHLP